MRSLLGSWHTSVVALLLFGALAAYLLGQITETQLVVAGTVITAIGKLLGADAAQVAALAKALPVATSPKLAGVEPTWTPDVPAAKGGES